MRNNDSQEQHSSLSGLRGPDISEMQLRLERDWVSGRPVVHSNSENHKNLAVEEHEKCFREVLGLRGWKDCRSSSRSTNGQSRYRHVRYSGSSPACILAAKCASGDHKKRTAKGRNTSLVAD